MFDFLSKLLQTNEKGVFWMLERKLYENSYDVDNSVVDW